MKPGPSIGVTIDGLAVSFALPRRAVPILRLIDGRRSLGEIHAALAAAEAAPLSWEAFRAEFDQFYSVLNGLNLLFLELPPAR